jgi:hypothetical protein
MNTYPNFISSVLLGTLLFNLALIGCGPDNGKRRQRIRKDQGVAGKQLGAKPAQAAAAAATADPSKQPPQTGATADPTQQTAATPPADTQQMEQPDLPPGDSSQPPSTKESTAVVPPTGENKSVTTRIEDILKGLKTGKPTSIQNIPEDQFVLTQIFGKLSYQENPVYQALLISGMSCQDKTWPKVQITQEEFLNNAPSHGSQIPLTSELTIPCVIKKDPGSNLVFEKDIGVKFVVENGDIGKLDQIISAANGVSAKTGGILAIALDDKNLTKPKIPSGSDPGVTYAVGSGPDSGAQIVFEVAQDDVSPEIRVFVDLSEKNKTISNFVLIYQKPTPSK